jgi:hypothetical protein
MNERLSPTIEVPMPGMLKPDGQAGRAGLGRFLLDRSIDDATLFAIRTTFAEPGSMCEG